MAIEEHVEIARGGKRAVAQWRRSNVRGVLDLSEANLDGIDLRGADLRGANLHRALLSLPFGRPRKRGYAPAKLQKALLAGAGLQFATLCGVNLAGATLQSADMEGAHLSGADLTGANLTLTIFENANLEGATLTRATLTGANLHGANLRNADLACTRLDKAVLREANLSRANCTGAVLADSNLIGASLVQTDLSGADLRGSRVYGVSAWDVITDDRTDFRDLDVSPNGDGETIVDDLAVAQFYYFLLSNPNVRRAINTIGRRGVLILGRFTPERKRVLDAIREKLRDLGYLPFLFDFQKPDALDLTETVRVLAGLSRFVIVDITNPSSVPLELQAIVPAFGIPFVPIIQKGERPFGMFKSLTNEHADRMLPRIEYSSREVLLKALEHTVIPLAIERSEALAAQKDSEPPALDADKLVSAPRLRRRRGARRGSQ